MRWLGSIANSTDMNLSKLRERVKGIGAWCIAVHGVAESLNNKNWLTLDFYVMVFV